MRERTAEQQTVPAPARRRDPDVPAPHSRVSGLVGLQRSVGNRAVARLLQRTVAEAPVAQRKLVCWGVKGPDVSYLQSRLNGTSEVTLLLEVDGKFGPKTYAAVKQFQRAHPPLRRDGVVGPLTWAAVEAIPDEPKDREAMSIKYYEAGAADYKAKRYGHAHDFFEQAGELSEGPEYLFNRAQSLRLLGGRRKEAIALYEQYIAQVSDADSVLAKRLVAELRGPGKTGDADVDAKAVDALYEQALAAHAKGRHGEALDLLEAAGEVSDDPTLLFNRAQSLRLLGGRRKEAIALYEQYIAQVSDADSV
ncbi:MAG: peptidoglycan-binding protein, partial [Burkholderiales bacterium]